jgi:IMP dehydrogenase
MPLRIRDDAFTFNDVSLVPRESDVLPTEAHVHTRLTRGIELKIPVISAAMDTVTTAPMAIAMARQGGLGVIHKNLPPEEQALEVDLVKRSESGMIVNPITLAPERRVSDALALMREFRISGVPIVEDGGRLVGIVTNRDLLFESDSSQELRLVMTSNGLMTAPVGTTLEEAERILHHHRIEKLPVVDDNGTLRGLITVKDIHKKRQFPSACKDEMGRLRVAAAVEIGSGGISRAEKLAAAGCDVIVVDTAHGHSRRVIETVRELRGLLEDRQIIAGNVATAEGAIALASAGADGVKVGMGPASICTTRVVAGIGVHQLTAIAECADALGDEIPIIADGGIEFSGDIVKAIASGGHSVMIGSLLAGTEESPGETILYEGRAYKAYRGMGSLPAMVQGSGDRYFQDEVDDERKMIPEGIEGRVPYKGPVAESLFHLVGGLRTGMGYCGCRTLEELRTQTEFVKITGAGLREAHPHGVTITREAPNYQLSGMTA